MHPLREGKKALKQSTIVLMYRDERKGGIYSEGYMDSRRSVSLKVVLVAGLLAAIGLVLSLSGIGLPAILLTISILAVLLWWFIRRPGPEGELPSASVSCCHYLGDQAEERLQPPK